MFSRKKPEPPKRRNHDLSQFGIMDIPDDFDPSIGFGGGNDSNDSDLEAELAAIASGGGKPKEKPKPKLVPPTELDKMIAVSLKDVSSEDDDEVDDDDPDLLGELKNIVGEEVTSEEIASEMTTNVQDDKTTNVQDDKPEPQLFMPTTTTNTIDIIRQRLEIYKQAEANAKASGEGAKARRLGRGLKTLNDLLKQSLAGKSINVDDIPPEISIKTTQKSPSEDSIIMNPAADSPPKLPVREAPSIPHSPQSPASPNSISAQQTAASTPDSSAVVSESKQPSNPLLDQMHNRQREYKSAALQSKRNGNTAEALQFLKVVKQFDMVIKMCEDGQEVDLSDMPPPPDQFKEFIEKMQTTAAAATAETANSNTSTQDNTEIRPAEPETTETAEESKVEPKTILEALQQRLDKYKSVEESAKAEGNSSKARRFGRIIKQYEDAIKLHKTGKHVAYDELPVPPGFGPLPTENNSGQSPSATPNTVVASPTSPTNTSKSNNVTVTPTPDATPTPVEKRPSPQQQDLTTRTSGNQQKNNLAEQQMKLLLERQKEFKVAAIEAKKAGEIDQAKEYLKIFKGFDALLNAASSGLPVDLSTLPVPPSQRDDLEASFAIVSTEECDPDISDIGIRVEEQLAKQLMMCKNTRDHHKAMGDIAGMNRFENLALTVQKDLDLVRYSKRKNFPLPKFHYENRSFNIVHCNTDLTDNELEVVVVRGINYNVANPKDVDTYVKIEFPLLNDEFFKTKTNLIRNTDSPDYDQRFKIEIQRGNRQFHRIFKRHGVKFEVYSRGGFLRSDILIGTVNVKLQPLETKCDLHDTFNLMEGRKAVGGQLEVKIRVRNPILTKQMEHINEKWLVLDH